MLEHQSEPGAQSALSRTWSTQVLATRNDGGGNLQRAEGRIVLESSREVTTSFPSFHLRFPFAFTVVFVFVSPPGPLSFSEINETEFRAVNRIKNRVASLLNQMDRLNYRSASDVSPRPLRPGFSPPFKGSAKRNFIIRWIFAARRDKLSQESSSDRFVKRKAEFSAKLLDSFLSIIVPVVVIIIPVDVAGRVPRCGECHRCQSIV